MRLAVCGQFFLDPELWDELVVHIRGRKSMRAWSAGCHVGKEPYSLAMMLEEEGIDSGRQIFATDYDPVVLEAARAGGPFSARDVSLLTLAQVRAYLEPGGPPHFVRASVRAGVRFQIHDVRAAAPESDLDLVLYRNVEPFFEEEENSSIHRTLCAALRPGGLLFVGGVERIRNAAELGLEKLGTALYRRRK